MFGKGLRTILVAMLGLAAAGPGGAEAETGAVNRWPEKKLARARKTVSFE